MNTNFIIGTWTLSVEFAYLFYETKIIYYYMDKMWVVHCI